MSLDCYPPALRAAYVRSVRSALLNGYAEDEAGAGQLAQDLGPLCDLYLPAGSSSRLYCMAALRRLPNLRPETIEALHKLLAEFSL